MFWRMVLGALFRQKRKMLMIALTVALGASLATGLIQVMLGVGDKLNAELKRYGANINVLPKEASLLDDLYGQTESMGVRDESPAYLKEEELPRIKTIFWAFNIVDYAPYLNLSVQIQGRDGSDFRLVGTWFEKELALPTRETVVTGMKRLKNWWTMEGGWLQDGDRDGILIGRLLADRLGVHVGDRLTLAHEGRQLEVQVRGIFTSGAGEDQSAYMPLAMVQELGQTGPVVSRVEVSALTTPDNDLARKAAHNPKSLTIKEWDVWYCTAYVSAICYQIQEVMTDAVAQPIRQVAESEGAILQKTQYLMLLITILSMLGSALGIANLVTSSVMERSSEIGLMKAIGAWNVTVMRTILTEIFLTGLMGGVLGYLCGIGAAQLIAHTVFGSGIALSPVAIPIVAMMVLLVTLLGSVPAMRYLLSLNPATVLHGR